MLKAISFLYLMYCASIFSKFLVPQSNDVYLNRTVLSLLPLTVKNDLAIKFHSFMIVQFKYIYCYKSEFYFFPSLSVIIFRWRVSCNSTLLFHHIMHELYKIRLLDESAYFSSAMHRTSFWNARKIHWVM